MVKNFNAARQFGVEQSERRGLTLAWDQLQAMPNGRSIVRTLDFGSSGFRSVVLIRVESTSLAPTVRLPM